MTFKDGGCHCVEFDDVAISDGTERYEHISQHFFAGETITNGLANILLTASSLISTLPEESNSSVT
jgi:hypothetical protein